MFIEKNKIKHHHQTPKKLIKTKMDKFCCLKMVIHQLFFFATFKQFSLFSRTYKLKGLENKLLDQN